MGKLHYLSALRVSVDHADAIFNPLIHFLRRDADKRIQENRNLDAVIEGLDMLILGVDSRVAEITKPLWGTYPDIQLVTATYVDKAKAEVQKLKDGILTTIHTPEYSNREGLIARLILTVLMVESIKDEYTAEAFRAQVNWVLS